MAKKKPRRQTANDCDMNDMELQWERFRHKFHVPSSPRTIDQREAKKKIAKKQKELRVRERQVRATAAEIWNYCREKGKSLDANHAIETIMARIQRYADDVDGVVLAKNERIKEQRLKIARLKRTIITLIKRCNDNSIDTGDIPLSEQ